MKRNTAAVELSPSKLPRTIRLGPVIFGYAIGRVKLSKSNEAFLANHEEIQISPLAAIVSFKTKKRDQKRSRLLLPYKE